MKTFLKTQKLLPLFALAAFACLLFVSGCARYSHNVNVLYEPSANVRGGAGEVFIVIPENRQSLSPDIKWVIGKVKNDDNKIIDEIFSPRSPAEIIQAAFSQEFKRAGYTIITTTKRPADNQQVIDLTKTEIEMEQTSDIVDLKAKCRVLVGLDVFRNGQQIKRLQYEATSSKSGIKDRDLLAKKVLNDALTSIMKKAVPELHSLLSR